MIEVWILAFALSMDAFAVSIGLGIKNKQDIKIMALKAGLFFGIFQAFMPFLGFLGGIGLREYIQGYDKIVAFVLLLLIGGKMLYEAFTENIEDRVSNFVLLLKWYFYITSIGKTNEYVKSVDFHHSIIESLLGLKMMMIE